MGQGGTFLNSPYYMYRFAIPPFFKLNKINPVQFVTGLAEK